MMKRTADRLLGDNYHWSVLGAGAQPDARCRAWLPPWAATCASAWRTRSGSARASSPRSNAQQVTQVRKILEGPGPGDRQP